MGMGLLELSLAKEDEELSGPLDYVSTFEKSILTRILYKSFKLKIKQDEGKLCQAPLRSS